VDLAPVNVLRPWRRLAGQVKAEQVKAGVPARTVPRRPPESAKEAEKLSKVPSPSGVSSNRSRSSAQLNSSSFGDSQARMMPPNDGRLGRGS
jgi:hypothetical protein